MDRLNSIPASFLGKNMILYLETQLEKAYNVYRRNQIKHDAAFINKENFRTMFEQMMEAVEDFEPEEDTGY